MAMAMAMAIAMTRHGHGHGHGHGTADFLENRYKNLGFGLGTSGRDTILVDGCRRSANPLVGLFDRKLQPHNHDDTGFQGDLVRYGMARTREASDTEQRGA